MQNLGIIQVVFQTLNTKFQNTKIGTTIYSVCVLTGLQTEKYDRIMRWWSSKPQSRIATVLDSDTYCYVILPFRPSYYSTHRSYQTSSSDQLCVPCIRPSIYAYHTRSFAHLGVYPLRTRILVSHPDTPPLYGSCCGTLSLNCLLLLAPRDIYSKVAQSCFFVVSWRHQASLLRSPPPHPFSPAHTLNISCNATHCATVAWRLPI